MASGTKGTRVDRARGPVNRTALAYGRVVLAVGLVGMARSTWARGSSVSCEYGM